MKKSNGRRVFDVFNIIFMVLVLVLSMYPFIYQLALSLSSSVAVLHGKVSLIPVDFTIKTYTDIIKEDAFRLNYWNTIA